MKQYYKILGVKENATDSEVYAAYSELRAKYKDEMFEEGKKGNDAAKNLTELERAYEEIMTFRREHAAKSDEGLLKEVDLAIKAGDLKKAQEVLDSFNERSAEWHYLQSVVFYQKGWANESKKQLEIARQMAPGTAKYDKAYERLNEKINGGASAGTNQTTGAQGGAAGGANNSGNANNANNGSYDEPQMGGDGCLDFCVRLAICNCILNCCCNMGRC